MLYKIYYAMLYLIYLCTYLYKCISIIYKSVYVTLYDTHTHTLECKLQENKEWFVFWGGYYNCNAQQSSWHTVGVFTKYLIK